MLKAWEVAVLLKVVRSSICHSWLFKKMKAWLPSSTEKEASFHVHYLPTFFDPPTLCNQNTELIYFQHSIRISITGLSHMRTNILCCVQGLVYFTKKVTKGKNRLRLTMTNALQSAWTTLSLGKKEKFDTRMNVFPSKWAVENAPDFWRKWPNGWWMKDCWSEEV